MRYRLMASYLGASYQAAVGPSDRDVTLFAAPPPPEEHGFSPAPGGIWLRQVRLDQLDALWESRPIGSYHGEPCLVLDDLGDRLHIVYLGMDERRAAQLGYWEVDRGVFEVVVPRYDITDLAEERHEFPIALLLSALPAPGPRALGSGQPSPAGPMPGPGAPGNGQNGAGMTRQPAGRAIGAIGPGSGVAPGGPAVSPAAAGGPAVPGGPVVGGGRPVAGGMAATAGPGPGGMAEWNAQNGPAGGQQLVTGAYYPAAGPAQNGAGPPVPAGFPNAPGTPGGVQPTGAPQLPGGQQMPAGSRGAGGFGVPGTPGGQFAIAPSGQQGMQGAQSVNSAALLPAPTAPPPGGQVSGAQLQAAQQQAARQPLAPQFPPAPALPAAPQAAGTPQPVSVSQGTGPQMTMPQPAGTPVPQMAQAPASMAAWHGSPATDGNGQWYLQQATAQALPANGLGGPQQYAPPAQQASVNGYQQAPVLQPAAGVQPPQPGQSVPPGQPGFQGQSGQTQALPQPQAAQPAQAAGVPQFAAPGGASAPQPPAASPGVPAVSPGPATPAPTAQTGPITAPLPVPPVAPPPPAAPQQQAAPQPVAPQPLPTPAAPPEASATGPLTSLPATSRSDRPAPPALNAVGTLGKLSGAVRGRRAARKPRLSMSAIFADLVDMADIPRSAYSVDEEITGAMCLFKTDGGYEVFSCAEDARHEVRFFEEEESAYFYLFGVLAAEALRNGRLGPRRS
jgi:hypothetical protein